MTANIEIKWKHWYWFSALFCNFFNTFLLVIFLLLKNHSILTLTDKKSLIYFCSTASILLICFLTYLFFTYKETKVCKTLIKPERWKYLQFGAFTSFLSINLYILFGFLGYKYSVNWIYFSIFTSVVLGLTSNILLTFYEFCVAFDIFYHKNKNEIVYDFLKYHNKKINVLDAETKPKE